MLETNNSEDYYKQQLAIRFEAEAIPHLQIMKRIAYQLMKNQSEAEELVQETFAQALQGFARYQSGTNCRAWLCKIMFRKRSHWFRANKRFLPLDEYAPLLAGKLQPSLPPDFISDKLKFALLGLPINFREIVILCDVEELTYREAAECLNIPLGTVMSRLHRGRKMLRSAFDKATANSRSIRHLHYTRVKAIQSSHLLASQGV